MCVYVSFCFWVYLLLLLSSLPVVADAAAANFPLTPLYMYKKIKNSASVMLCVPTVTHPLGTKLKRV